MVSEAVSVVVLEVEGVPESSEEDSAWSREVEVVMWVTCRACARPRCVFGPRKGTILFA